MKIAVLINDAPLQKTICSILDSTGYLVSPASEHVDLFIVDKPIANTDVPTLLVAEPFEENNILQTLASGITDYLIQPIRRNELMTRVRVLLQRAYPNQTEDLELGPYLIEIHFARIALSGQFIELTRKEFELALLLFRNLGKPLSRAYMLDAVWSREPDIPSRTLDTHISRVRNKLQLHRENGFQLVPVYSYGYRLEAISDAV